MKQLNDFYRTSFLNEISLNNRDQQFISDMSQIFVDGAALNEQVKEKDIDEF